MLDSLLTDVGFDASTLESLRLDTVVLQNPLWRWVAAAVTLLIAWSVLSLALRLFRSRTNEGTGRAALAMDLLAGLGHVTGYWFVALLCFALALQWLQLGSAVPRVLEIVFTLGLWLQIGLWLSRVLKVSIGNLFRTRVEEDPAQLTSVNALRYLGQLILWSAVLLLGLDNLGVDISALIAGFGIGGIAVALAAQNILGDLFASLSIVLDRPFEVGDFIVVGDFMGVVDRVGLKTTRVRSLSGEQLVFGNTDLLSARIRNYKRMRERRVAFRFGVTYQTSSEQLRRIPDLCRQAVEESDGTRFDRAHFFEFGDSSLVFEVVFYVDTNDYNRYMDTQESINLNLFEHFEELGIDFAYPTRTLRLAGEPRLRVARAGDGADDRAHVHEPGAGGSG